MVNRQPNPRRAYVLRDVHKRRWRKDPKNPRMMIRIQDDGSDFVPKVTVSLAWLTVNCGPIALEVGATLPGVISDRIRRGEIPADLKFKGTNSDDDPPSPGAIRGARGRGLGEGSTRRRGGDETSRPARGRQVFPATRKGVCAAGDVILRGDLIQSDGQGGWIHVECENE